MKLYHFHWLLALALTWSTSGIHAQGTKGFYDPGTLQYWQKRYSDNVKALYNEELRRFVPVNVAVEVPLSPEKGPFYNFYARGGTIYLPVSAILFLDQIITAQLWLERNNYETDVVFDYLGMLKYRRFSTYPLPWPTLGIPADPYKDVWVDNMSQEYLKTAILWILAHEAGHVNLGHTRSSIQNELAADRFATNCFRQMGYIPKGMTILFTLYTNLFYHRGDFANQHAWESYVKENMTHPTTATRLRQLAMQLGDRPEDFVRNLANANKNETQRLRSMVGYMTQLSQKLASPDELGIMAFRAVTVKSAYLYRRKGKWAPKHRSLSRQPLEGKFSGLFEHTLKSGRIEKVPLTVYLQKEGTRIAGTWDIGLGTGELQGYADQHNTVAFTWKMGPDAGRGVLQTSATNYDLTARWGFANSDDNGGKWYLVKD